MRKITMLNRISIDGHFASLNNETGGMDWFIQDPEVDKYVRDIDKQENNNKSSTLILGRETFEMFENSWMPLLNDPEAPDEMKTVAKELTEMRKIVFSNSAKNSNWENTEFCEEDIVKFVKQLKRSEGEDILILGSGTIVQQLTDAKLIDEYSFILSPVIAGKGKPLFDNVDQLNLELKSIKSFESSNVVLSYIIR